MNNIVITYINRFKHFFKSLFRSKLSIKEQTFLAKRLSFLIRSGIPVLESLLIIKEQTRNPRTLILLGIATYQVSNGQSLSKSLKKAEYLFGSFAINIIEIGESTGILSSNLSYLADELQKKQMLKRKVISAFIYPIVVCVATLGITSFLVVYLFPKIMPIFLSLHVKIPLTTRIVMKLSHFISNFGIACIFISFGIAVLIAFTIKKLPKFAFFVDQLILRTPIVGPMTKYYTLANSMRTLALLLRSSMSLSEAVVVVKNTTQNYQFRYQYELLIERIIQGGTITSHIALYPDLFPDVMSQIISVGERTGDLENSCMYLAEFFEQEVDAMTKNLSNLVEPVLMIIMGIIVGFIAVSIITPIYSITQNLHA